MTRNKFTQKGAAATPQTGGGAMPPGFKKADFKQPIKINRLSIQKEIAALRQKMGLPDNPAADERLARARPEDFPEVI